MAFQQTMHHPYLESILRCCKQFAYKPKELPTVAGVYFVTIVVACSIRLYYLGHAGDIRDRFLNHHRKHEFRFLQRIGVPLTIYILPTPWLSGSERYDLEQHFIKQLNPLQNDQPWLVPQKTILKVVKLPKDLLLNLKDT